VKIRSTDVGVLVQIGLAVALVAALIYFGR
jgi:hypothetical protein